MLNRCAVKSLRIATNPASAGRIQISPGNQGSESPRRRGLGAIAIANFSGIYALFGVLRKDGIDLSMTTHGNLSSRKIAFCGANGVGSSSDAIVKSMVSESLLSSKNRCVPQQAANDRIRFAYGILRGSPFVTTRSWRGTDPHCT